MIRPTFKTLTMRIWTTFTVTILLIIFSLSFFYFFAFKRIQENSEIKDLKVAHDIILKNNDFTKPTRLSEMQNLRGSRHFTYTIKADESKIIDDANKPENIPIPMDGINRSSGDPDKAVKDWMITFIQGNNIDAEEFKKTYNKQRFLFIISSVNTDPGDRQYLISYMPSMRDNGLLEIVMIIGAVFIVIGFFTAKVIASYISKPLKELEEYTERIAHKNWGEDVVIKSDDEISRLADAMNRMQKELKRADEEEKNFLQSISHDLKTPVMIIMSHAEAIIDGIYIDSVENTAEIIKNEAISLEKKIKQLLYLNTLDYVMENKDKNDDINLRDLILSIVNRFEMINSNIEWKLDIEALRLLGNEEKLKVAIENIIENGLRYAEKEVQVTLKEEEKDIILEIYNDGPHIKNENVKHIFDNFYKDKTGNFGLGLAITKKIVVFHNGSIEAVNREKGVSFILRFNKE